MQPELANIPVFSIGDRLRKARERVGMSQSAFAHELGISPRTVSSCEREEFGVKRSTVMAWSMRTGVPYEWLQTGAMPADQKGPEPTHGGDAGGLDTSPKA